MIEKGVDLAEQRLDKIQGGLDSVEEKRDEAKARFVKCSRFI